MHPRFCALSSLSFALGSLRFNIWHLAPYIRSPAVVGALLLARGSVMLIERQNLPGRPGMMMPSSARLEMRVSKSSGFDGSDGHHRRHRGVAANQHCIIA
jgi:hypothetical protein